MSDIQEFDFSVGLLRAILWEYNTATNLQEILDAKEVWYLANQSQFWNDFVTNIFDVRTANQFGLAVWGIILGIKLYVNIPSEPSKLAFGFDDPSFGNFDNSNFSDTNGSSYLLPLEVQRIAIQLRYANLIGSGTVPEINRLLKKLFGDQGVAFLYDYGNMHQMYIFDFTLDANLTYLFDNYDILPRPAGVKSGYYDNTKEYFGFDPYGVNFNNGNFGA